MSESLNRLAEVLEEELQSCRRLLDLAKDVRAAAVSADTELLRRIVSEQEAWAARLEAAEARRVRTAAEAAAELGLAGRPTLREIAAGGGLEPGARLRSLGRRLKVCASDLRQAGRRNALFLEHSLDHVDGFFAVLAAACAGRGPYGRSSRAPARPAALVLNRRA